MNILLFDIVNIQAMAKDRDYIGIAIIVVAFIFVITGNLIWGLAFGGIAILYRVLFLNRKNRLIEEIYTELHKIIKELERNTRTQKEVRFEDLQEWLPETKTELLQLCWKKLQENEVVLKDDNRWIVGNKSQ